MEPEHALPSFIFFLFREKMTPGGRAPGWLSSITPWESERFMSLKSPARHELDSEQNKGYLALFTDFFLSRDQETGKLKSYSYTGRHCTHT